MGSSCHPPKGVKLNLREERQKILIADLKLLSVKHEKKLKKVYTNRSISGLNHHI